ncbi:MAG: hypothetical protein WDZ53_06590 [Balneolales bacterium]
MIYLLTLNRLLVTSMLFVLLGCHITDTENINENESFKNESVFNDQQRHLHYQLNELIPGYGGIYTINEDGTLVARVTDPDEIDQVELAAKIRNFLSKESPSAGRTVEGGLQNMEIIFKASDYTYVQLIDWYDAIVGKVWNAAEVTGSSIGVTDNKIQFRMASNQHISQIKEILRASNVPENAIGFSYSGGDLPEPHPVYWK